MNSKKKVIIFDFDGTIADTLPIGYELYQQSAEKYHLKKFKSYPDFQDFLQLSVPQMLFRLRVSPFLFKKIVEEQLATISTKISDASLFPGIPEVIQILAKTHRLAIVSSSFASVIEAYLKKNKLDKYFSQVIGTETHKDKQEKIKQCLAVLHVEAKNVILIGDSTRDMKDGKKLGLTTIAVTYGIHPLKSLKKEKPDSIAQTPEDILRAVSTLM